VPADANDETFGIAPLVLAPEVGFDVRKIDESVSAVVRACAFVVYCDVGAVGDNMNGE